MSIIIKKCIKIELFIDIFSIFHFLFNFCHKLLNYENFRVLKKWSKFFSLKLVKSGQKIWHRLFSGKTSIAVKGYKFDILRDYAISQKMKWVKFKWNSALTKGEIGMGFFFRNGGSRSKGRARFIVYVYKK